MRLRCHAAEGPATGPARAHRLLLATPPFQPIEQVTGQAIRPCSKPLPNYLLALDVGDFRRVDLPSARTKRGEVPLAVWTAPGSEEKARTTFGQTPSMVEYFSERFGYDYVWPKYDQVTLRHFAGAMETATMVGFEESYLHGPGDPEDGEPAPDDAYPSWTSEDTIAHELAHHWFGDLVTCRSLGSIWINESFASFAHLLWNEHAGSRRGRLPAVGLPEPVPRSRPRHGRGPTARVLPL